MNNLNKNRIYICVFFTIKWLIHFSVDERFYWQSILSTVPKQKYIRYFLIICVGKNFSTDILKKYFVFKKQKIVISSLRAKQNFSWLLLVSSYVKHMRNRVLCAQMDLLITITISTYIIHWVKNEFQFVIIGI